MKQAMEFGPLKNAMSLPEVQEGLGKFKEKCGFDPMQKIDDLYIAIRGVANKPQFGFVVRGSFTQAELQACITKMNEEKGGLIPAAAVNGHPAFQSAPDAPEAAAPAGEIAL